MPIRIVLFDAVGTLIEPHPPVAEAYEAAGLRWGSTLSRAEIGERFRTAWARDSSARSESQRATSAGLATSETGERDRWRRIVRTIFDDLPEPAGESLFADLWEHFAQPSHWRLFGDVEPAWRAIAARGLPIGVASNFDVRLRNIAAAHPPLATCSNWFISSEIGWAKPADAFYAAVEQQLQLLPEQILLIGDDLENDAVAPRHRGWRTLHLRRSGRDLSVSEIHSLSQAPDRLQQMSGGVG